MERHFTTTVYLLHEEKVLLLFHPKPKKWLPPGGHIEMDESPPIAARRKVMEETEPISEDSIKWFPLEEVKSMKSDGEIFAKTQEVIQTILPAEVLS